MTVDQILVLPFLRTRIHQPPPTKGIGKDECFKVIVPPFGQDNVCRVSRLIARTDYVTHLIPPEFHAASGSKGCEHQKSREEISGGGNRSRKRWYGVVRSVTDSEITIEQYETSAEAIRAARAGPDVEALEEERARLVARIAEIDALLGGEGQ